MSDFELNEAEKALVIAARNRKAAEEQEKLAKQNLEMAGKIETMKRQAADFSLAQTDLKNAVLGFLAQLNYNQPNAFVLESTPRQETFRATNNSWRREDTVVYDEVVVKYESFLLVSKKQLEGVNEYSRIRIKVEKNDKGYYQMILNGLPCNEKAFKKVTTVLEKVNAFFAENDLKIAREKQAKDFSIRAIDQMKLKYPQAASILPKVIEHTREVRRYHREVYAKTNYIEVKFENGVIVNYTYSSPNNEIVFKLHSTNFTSLDMDSMIEWAITAPKKQIAPTIQ